MRFTAKGMLAGCLAVGLGGSGAPLPAQTAAPAQSVPDAPRPQTLPTLNTITPTAPAIPNAPAAVPNAPAPQGGANGSDGEFVPGRTLPSSRIPAPEDAAADTTTQTGVGSGASPVRHASDSVVFTNFVQVPFTVKDSKGVLVPGLTYRDVRVYENGLLQSPRLFTVDPIPLSVAIVIDQSVTFDTMAKVNASLEALQSAFTPYDELAVFTYNNGVKEQTSFSGAQSTRVQYALQRSKSGGREQTMAIAGPLAQTVEKNNQAIDPNLNGNNNPTLQANIAPPREYHTLNDAILTAAVELTKAGKGRRRVIFVISDGKEYGSQAKENEVIRFLQHNQISVYATLVGDTSVPGVEFLDKFHIPFQMRDNVLPRYVSQAGGDYNAAFRPKAIENSFARLSEEVRTQYVIGYYSHEPFIDGKFRPYEVRVMRPNLDVLAPKGYYPNAQSSVQGQPGSPQTPQPGTPVAPAPNPGNAPTTP